VEAVRRRPVRRAVIRRGAVVAETAPARPRLSLPGRPETVRPGLI
jgi:hypothetical protein